MESGKKIENAKITNMEQLADGIYSMWVHTPDIAAQAIAGQFVALYCKEGSRMLPRPISLCEIDREQGLLRLVFRVAGKGTEEFAKLQAGDTIEIMGPLGNGFAQKVDFAASAEQVHDVVLVGGGIGIPPMLELAKAWHQVSGKKCKVVLGYRDAHTFLAEDFKPYAEVALATEDGSLGTKGNVIDAMNALGWDPVMVCACGPTPMLRGLKAFAAERQIPAYISMEERMACGIGACLACVCQSKEKDHHTNVTNKRVCKDGPVFLADEVEL